MPPPAHCREGPPPQHPTRAPPHPRRRKDFDKKLQQLEAKKRIDASKQLNQMRLQVLQAKQAVLEGVVEDCRNEISALVASPAQYKALLTQLICQSMHHLGGSQFLVRCRECDVVVVEQCLEPARARFQQETGRGAPSVSLDRGAFLPPAPGSSSDPDVETCLGGVAVTSPDGRIVSSNTLDDRLRIVVEDNLPGIRANLFP